MAVNELQIRHLQWAITVAKAGSLHEAARRHGVTEPMVRRAMDKLTEYLGVDLFDMTPQGSRPTAVGKIVLDRASQVLAGALDLREYAQRVSDGQAGRIRITCHPGHLQRFLGRVLQEFMALHPEYEVVLTRIRDDRREDSGLPMYTDLVEGAVDFAVGAPHNDDSLQGRNLFTMSVVLVLPEDDRHRNDKTVPITLLQDRRVVAAPVGYMSRELLETAAQGAHFRLNVVAETPSPVALLALGRSRFAWPAMSDEYWPLQPGQKEYPVIVDGDGQPLIGPVYLQWRDGDLSPAGQKFVEMCEDWANRDRAGVVSARSRTMLGTDDLASSRPEHEVGCGAGS